MPEWTLQLDAAGVNAALGQAFAGADKVNDIRELEPGRILVKQDYAPGMLRPGGVIAGPVFMSLADRAAYLLVFAHVGPELMAVTSNLNINFLRGTKPGPIYVEGRLLALGRRNVVCDVRMWTESPDRLAAQATVTYARAREPAAA